MTTQRKHVLIVDDDAMLVHALKVRCEQLGLDVHAAHDGLQALTLIRQAPPDLVFLDVNMPAADGLEVCRCLATAPELPPVPVIMLTGQADRLTTRWCDVLGAHYVQKGPDAWEEMQPVVCRLLGLKADTWEGAGKLGRQPPRELRAPAQVG